MSKKSNKKIPSEWVGASSRINTLWEKDGDTKETFAPTARDIRHMHLTECHEKQATVVKFNTAKPIGPEPPPMMRDTYQADFKDVGNPNALVAQDSKLPSNTQPDLHHSVGSDFQNQQPSSL